MRKFKFITGQYYHIYNRGVDKRDVFINSNDYVRFIKYIRIFIFNENFIDIPEAKPPQGRLSLLKPVDIICYCLNPNHYHFLLRQNVDDGISKYMHYISSSYTMYFNAKYNRSGSLFQGTFKAAEMKYDDHLLSLSVYVNANPQIHGIVKNASEYLWSSYQDYLGKRNGTLCSKEIILDEFKNRYEYNKYVDELMPEFIEQRKLQNVILE